MIIRIFFDAISKIISVNEFFCDYEESLELLGLRVKNELMNPFLSWLKKISFSKVDFLFFLFLLVTKSSLATC